jgi:hypothetical protein
MLFTRSWSYSGNDASAGGRRAQSPRLWPSSLIKKMKTRPACMMATAARHALPLSIVSHLDSGCAEPNKSRHRGRSGLRWSNQKNIEALFRAALELKSAAEFVLNDRDDAVALVWLAKAIKTFDVGICGARLN